MRTFVTCALCIFLLAGCGPRQDKVERRIEDGIEVVVNHLEPYRVGGAGIPVLTEIFHIDSENNEIEKLGLIDIRGFDVNPKGEIYVLRTIKGTGDFVFKFDQNGRFVKSFGRKGQGPGELQMPRHIAISKNNRLLISDIGRVLEYDHDGAFVKAYPSDSGAATSGPGSTLIAQTVDQQFRGDKQTMTQFVSLFDSELKKIRELDSLAFELSMSGIRLPEPLLGWSASSDRIFIANENRAYDIRVLGPDGTLKRRIKKEYTAVRVSAEFKARTLKPLPEPMRKVITFPEFHTPFQSLIAGEDGTLWVQTFEPGQGPGEFMFDIFNKEGVFIGRKSLNAYVWESHLWVRLAGNKLYCLKEKESGFKELIVYNIKWN